MGPGNRFQFGWAATFGVLLSVARFPYALTLTLSLPGVWISIGIGRSYLDDGPTCRLCQGSGTIEVIDGRGPDANTVDVDCDRCGGTGAHP
jgi:hypothetical protein